MQNKLGFQRAALAYLAALLTILVLDGIWLGFVAKGLYQVEMGGLMNDSPRWGPAAAFYLLYPLGLVLTVSAGGLPCIGGAALRGAVVGAMAYGAYNATNLAVIKGFSTKLAIIDFGWGTCATALAAAALARAASRGR